MYLAAAFAGGCSQWKMLTRRKYRTSASHGTVSPIPGAWYDPPPLPSPHLLMLTFSLYFVCHSAVPTFGMYFDWIAYFPDGVKFGFGFVRVFFSVPLPNRGRVDSVQDYQQKIYFFLWMRQKTYSADLMVGVAGRKCGVLCVERFDALIT